jgi:alpha-mannosidase
LGQLIKNVNSKQFSRSWKVYLLSDVCTDYTWAYDSLSAMKADDAALLRAELDAGTRYNLVHSRQVDYFLEAYPYLADQLFTAIRAGRITLNPVRNMTLFGNMSLEEIVRSFYPARRLARRYGLDDHFANIQETPTAPWILPTIFANIGVKHLVRSLLPYECPWVKLLMEPPVYWWEGPDGSRVLVRLRKEDYVEGSFVLKGVDASGVEAINLALHERILPEYEAHGDYPFDAIGLVGCYGDLSPKSKEFPARKAAAIATYNAQGWNNPQLIDATYAEFWADIVRQIAEKDISLPVIRGDYGTSWEAWPACLAVDFAGYRRAQARAMLADHLTAILSVISPTQHMFRNHRLEAAWDALLSLSDHAWNGSSDDSRKLNASLRRSWQQEANVGFDAVIAAGMHTLASHIPTDSDSLLFFNHHSWQCTSLARLSGKIPAALHDPLTGIDIPVQETLEQGERAGYCVVPEVPEIGYRILSFSLESPLTLYPSPLKGRGESDFLSQQERDGVRESSASISSPFYNLTLDPASGAIASLYDKTHQVELVDSAGSYKLNEAIYTTAPAGTSGPYTLYHPANFDGAVEQRPTLVGIEPVVEGVVFNEIKVHNKIGTVKMTTTYRLYHALDRIDICNEVQKPTASGKEQLDFAFPFNIPDRQVRLETPGAIIDPAAERPPGAGQSVHAVRCFMDLFNADYGVTLVMIDNGLAQFGRGPNGPLTGEDPVVFDPNAALFCLALDNVYDWNESIHDQGGVTHFTFRYRIQGHAGGFDPVAAIRFGWDDDLVVQSIPGAQTGDLPVGACSFVLLSPQNVILTGMRAGDAGEREQSGGLVLRLWEVSGEAATATIETHGLGSIREARQIDLLETDLEPLPVQAGKVKLPVNGRGLGALKIGFD